MFIVYVMFGAGNIEWNDVWNKEGDRQKQLNTVNRIWSDNIEYCPKIKQDERSCYLG